MGRDVWTDDLSGVVLRTRRWLPLRVQQLCYHTTCNVGSRQRRIEWTGVNSRDDAPRRSVSLQLWVLTPPHGCANSLL